MHPHLTEPGKIGACKDLIEQLQKCHESGFIGRYLGGCNKDETALAKCLRQERVDRTGRNRDTAKELKEKYEQTRQKYDD